jgi:hypothetical protein
MGGAAGLFVGASLLSFVELIYHFTLRLFVTVTYLKNKHRHHNLAPQSQQVQVFYSLFPYFVG